MKTGQTGIHVYKEVLLIDDDPIDLMINEKMLTSYQFTEKTIKCNSGTEALKLLGKRLNESQNLPEIILLDYFMPEMDGGHFIAEFERLRNANSHTASCAIVVLTALRSPEKKQALSENPSVMMVVNKPLTQKILEEIGQVLSGKS